MIGEVQTAIQEPSNPIYALIGVAGTATVGFLFKFLFPKMYSKWVKSQEDKKRQQIEEITSCKEENIKLNGEIDELKQELAEVKKELNITVIKMGYLLDYLRSTHREGDEYLEKLMTKMESEKDIHFD